MIYPFYRCLFKNLSKASCWPDANGYTLQSRVSGASDSKSIAWFHGCGPGNLSDAYSLKTLPNL